MNHREKYRKTAAFLLVIVVVTIMFLAQEIGDGAHATSISPFPSVTDVINDEELDTRGETLQQQVVIYNVKDFGAKGDGVTDDTLAIQLAINSTSRTGGGEVFFPPGIYLIGNYVSNGRSYPINYYEQYLLDISDRSNIVFKGVGAKSIIKLRDHLLDGLEDFRNNAHMLQGYNVRNIRFTGLFFDMNGSNNLTPQSHIRNAMAIRISGGQDVTIDHCFFYNCAGHNVIALSYRVEAQNRRARLYDNIFKNGGHYVGSPTINEYNKDFSFVYNEWDDVTIARNHIEQEDKDIALRSWTGGIELHGSNNVAKSNKIIGCNPAVYITGSQRNEKIPMNNVTVAKNDFENCVRGVSVWTDAKLNDISIVNNNISLYTPVIHNSKLIGIEMVHNNEVWNRENRCAEAINHLVISGNYIGNNLSEDRMREKYYRVEGMELTSMHNSMIENNRIENMTGAGIYLFGSPWGNVKVDIISNQIIDCGISATANKSGICFYFGADGSNGMSRSPKLPKFWDDIYIGKNKFINQNITKDINQDNLVRKVIGKVFNTSCTGMLGAFSFEGLTVDLKINKIIVDKNNEFVNLPKLFLGISHANDPNNQGKNPGLVIRAN